MWPLTWQRGCAVGVGGTGGKLQQFIKMGPGQPPRVLHKASEEPRILKQGPFLSLSFSFLKTRRIQKAGTGKSPFTVSRETRGIAAARSGSKETRPSTGKKGCWLLSMGATSGGNIREPAGRVSTVPKQWPVTAPTWCSSVWSQNSAPGTAC